MFEFQNHFCPPEKLETYNMEFDKLLWLVKLWLPFCVYGGRRRISGCGSSSKQRRENGRSKDIIILLLCNWVLLLKWKKWVIFKRNFLFDESVENFWKFRGQKGSKMSKSTKNTLSPHFYKSDLAWRRKLKAVSHPNL